MPTIYWVLWILGSQSFYAALANGESTWFWQATLPSCKLQCFHNAGLAMLIFDARLIRTFRGCEGLDYNSMDMQQLFGTAAFQPRLSPQLRQVLLCSEHAISHGFHRGRWLSRCRRATACPMTMPCHAIRSRGRWHCGAGSQGNTDRLRERRWDATPAGGRAMQGQGLSNSGDAADANDLRNWWSEVVRLSILSHPIITWLIVLHVGGTWLVISNSKPQCLTQDHPQTG